MVARYPSPVGKKPYNPLQRLKDNYGQDVSELARIKRGPWIPGSKPTPPVKSSVSTTKPVSSNGVTPAKPTPVTAKKSFIPNPNNDPNIFLKNHPVLAKLSTREQQGKFLDNHPRIAKRAGQIAAPKTPGLQKGLVGQDAILRRLKRVSK